MVKVAQAYEVVRINKRTKEVKPEGHGKATRGHELHLRVGFRESHDGRPLVCLYRLGQDGLIMCGWEAHR
jgi:hypothetical protein